MSDRQELDLRARGQGQKSPGVNRERVVALPRTQDTFVISPAPPPPTPPFPLCLQSWIPVSSCRSSGITWPWAGLRVRGGGGLTVESTQGLVPRCTRGFGITCPSTHCTDGETEARVGRVRSGDAQ